MDEGVPKKMSEEIQPLNYCAHALDQIRALIPKIPRDMPGTKAGYEAVGTLLTESVKYLLPNCAELIEIRELRQGHINSMRLPYPVVALEVPWVLPDEDRAQQGDLYAPKRIALCVHLNAYTATLLPGARELLGEVTGGVIVIPLSWTIRDGNWTIPMGGAFVPYSFEVQPFVPDERPGSLSSPKTKHMPAKPVVLLLERYQDAVKRFGARAVEAVTLEMARESILALIQMGCVINCANIVTPVIAPSAKLNKKRESRGDTPFFEYRVLQVARHKGNGEGMGGTHASPRAHLRAGHIRRLDDKTIWVSSTVVNAGSPRGVVEKDYALSRSHTP